MSDSIAMAWGAHNLASGAGKSTSFEEKHCGCRARSDISQVESPFGGKSRSRGVLKCDIQSMNWILVIIAVVLFVVWLVVRVFLTMPLGVLNLLWMLAIVFLIIAAVRRFFQ